MQFDLRYASRLSDKSSVEVNTLDELRDLALKVNSSLVIKFQGVTGTERGFSEDADEQEIIVYDSYIE